MNIQVIDTNSTESTVLNIHAPEITNRLQSIVSRLRVAELDYARFMYLRDLAIYNGRDLKPGGVKYKLAVKETNSFQDKMTEANKLEKSLYRALHAYPVDNIEDVRTKMYGIKKSSLFTGCAIEEDNIDILFDSFDDNQLFHYNNKQP